MTGSWLFCRGLVEPPDELSGVAPPAGNAILDRFLRMPGRKLSHPEHGLLAAAQADDASRYEFHAVRQGVVA